MRLGTIERLREALAGRDANGKLQVGTTYARELKIAAGFKGCRLFDIDAVVKWLEAHPTWRIPRQQRRYPLPAGSKPFQRDALAIIAIGNEEQTVT
jgi:hypothetical protein